MKSLLLFCTVFFAFAASSQTIKMKIASYTPTDGEPVVALQFADTLPTSVGGSSGGVTKLEFVKIKKPTGLSSIELLKRSLVATILPEVDFEYYDAANTLFYKIVLKDVQVAHFSYLTPECSNCTSLSNQVWFDYSKIEITDVINNMVLRYNRASRTTY